MEEKIPWVAERKLGESPQRIDRVSEGLIHQTFLLVLEDRELVMQVSDADEERERSMRRKCQVMSRNTSLPIPDLVAGPDIFAKDGSKRMFFIMEKMPGKQLNEEYSEELGVETGRMLALFHDIRSFERAAWLSPGKNGFELYNFEEGSLKDWILSELEENLEILRENGFGEICGEIRAFYDDNGDNLPEDFSAVLCHGDFSPDNLLIEDGGISGILDFDYVYAGHRQRDLVKTANSFLVEGFDSREEIYQGYRKEKELDESFESNEPLYRMETLVAIVASLFKLGEDMDEEQKKHYREMLRENLEECRNNLGV
ncbi:MAG: phosphotransferase family protein [Candidatus Nanohalobium sp.]